MRRRSSSPSPPKPAQARTLAIVDFDKTRKMVDNDRALFEKVVQLFLLEAATQMQRIDQGLASGDADILHRCAHALRGVVGIFAAERTVQATIRLEQQATHPEASLAVAELKASLDELEQAIRAYRW